MVDNAQIIYALLKLTNKHQVTVEQAKQIENIAKELFDYYENDFDSDNSSYKFKSGVNYWADGVRLPWNMQNIYGLSLLELYKLTNNELYRERVKELFLAYSLEWFVEQDKLQWHYWPNSFYEGWSMQDNISVNTPIRTASVDTLLEDVSHASSNVLFILNYYKQIEGSYNENIVIEQLKNTLSGLKVGKKYSRFISGDVEYDASRIIFFPYHGAGWAKLENEQLRSDAVIGIPSVDVFFEGDKVFSYLSFIHGFE